LNPKHLIWVTIKGWVAVKKATLKLNDVTHLTKEGSASTTLENRSYRCHHVVKAEAKHFESKQLEMFTINPKNGSNAIDTDKDTDTGSLGEILPAVIDEDDDDDIHQDIYVLVLFNWCFDILHILQLYMYVRTSQYGPCVKLHMDSVLHLKRPEVKIFKNPFPPICPV
jgi:hypothetical protein